MAKGRLLQSEKLAKQSANHTKGQFANLPDLAQAIIYAMDAHQTMSQLAHGSKPVQEGLKDVLNGPGKLQDSLAVPTAEASD